MAWNEIHQSFWTHKKTLRLAVELGIPTQYAAGLLGQFWAWALDNIPWDGSLDGISPQMVAETAGWKKDPDKFFNAVVSTGWIDRDEETGIYYVHDWQEYGGKLARSREIEKKRSKERREKSKTDRGSTNERPPVDRQTAVGRVEQSRVDQSRPEQNTDQRSASASTEDLISDVPPGVPRETDAAAAQRNADLDRIQTRFAQITGRLQVNPLDYVAIKESLDLAGGDADRVLAIMNTIAERRAKRTDLQPITSFAYFRRAVEGEIDLQRAKDQARAAVAVSQPVDQEAIQKAQERLAASCPELAELFEGRG